MNSNINGTFCEDIDEVISDYKSQHSCVFHLIKWLLFSSQCVLYNPCDPLTRCINLAPGFRCEPCPDGFEGIHVNGYYAEMITQDYKHQICTGMLVPKLFPYV